MKINLNNLDSENLDLQKFEKIKSKKHKLKGKQSVKQLVSQVENYSDPDAKFENSDLNELCRLRFLGELISDIKTGKRHRFILAEIQIDLWR